MFFKCPDKKLNPQTGIHFLGVKVYIHLLAPSVSVILHQKFYKMINILIWSKFLKNKAKVTLIRYGTSFKSSRSFVSRKTTVSLIYVANNYFMPTLLQASFSRYCMCRTRKIPCLHEVYIVPKEDRKRKGKNTNTFVFSLSTAKKINETWQRERIACKWASSTVVKQVPPSAVRGPAWRREEGGASLRTQKNLGYT